MCIGRNTLKRGDKLKIKLRIEMLKILQNNKGWSDKELAKKMGISRSRLWRARLPENHKDYCSPGESFIVGALNAFPNQKFEDLFFFERVCSVVHENSK